ncbi:MAG: dihydrolipoamide acetyltransferase family protein [Bryobacteraceae bacterium]
MAIEITVPRLGWSMDEGMFAGWLKQPGDRVQPGDMIFALESDKVTQDVESLDGGILYLPPDAVKEGDAVVVGQLLGFLLAEGEAPPEVTRRPENVSAAPAPAPVASLTQPSALRSGKVPVTPRARRAADELGVDPRTVRGTGRGGRVRERDVREATPASIPVIGMRRTIADRMVQSRDNTVPVTLTCRADATQLVALRDGFATKPAITDIVAKLAAVALRSHPALGARWEGGRLVLPGAIHIGIAVDTPHGLIVLVVRDVDSLALPQIAERSRGLIEAARARRIKSEDLEGACFSISNLGGFGIDAFTPVIHYPETAVLGLGAIRFEPVALADGTLTARKQFSLSLTFDHRAVDGAPAARFLQALAGLIEHPEAAVS